MLVVLKSSAKLKYNSNIAEKITKNSAKLKLHSNFAENQILRKFENSFGEARLFDTKKEIFLFLNKSIIFAMK